jgi:hypothetical protein
MSGTNIECTQCGDAVAVESRTVTLPFVCMQCEAAVEDFDATTQQYEDMAPVSRFDEDTAEIDSAYEDPSVTDNLSDLSDEFASVENTTLLIEDLEKQIANLQEKNDAQQRIIVAGTDFTIELQTTADDRLVEINGLDFQLAEVKSALNELIIASLEEMIRLTKRATAAELTNRSLAVEVSQIKAQRDDSLEQRTFWKDQARQWRVRLEKEESKGLWQHIKEATYDWIS